MTLRNAFSWWRRGRSWSAAGARTRPPVSPRPSRPGLEALEDRRVLTTFTNQAYVASLFQGLLGRDADTGSLNFWSGLLNSGQSFQQVAGGIISSPEYRGRQVEDVYERTLNRQADARGESAFTSLLAQGQTLEQVKADIYGSPEFFVRAGGTPQGFLNILFQNELNRSPTTAELAVFGANLGTQAQRTAVALEVLTSHEAQQVKVANYYRGLFVRNVDAAGLAFWTNQLAAGSSDETVMASLLGSAEFVGRLQSTINLSPGTDPVQVGDAFIATTNRLSGSVVGVPTPSIGTANTTQFVSFSITLFGTPFGPLRFPVVGFTVVPGTPVTASFNPSTEPLRAGVSTTQNIAPGFGSLPTLSTSTSIGTGFTALPGVNSAVSQANISPGFSQLTTIPFTGTLNPGLTTVLGTTTVNINPGFGQMSTTPFTSSIPTGFGQIVTFPTTTSSPVFGGFRQL